MAKAMDLRGQTFGRLAVIEQAGRDQYSKPLWKCMCVCGSEVIIRSRHLRSGHTKSCGCWHREFMAGIGKQGAGNHATRIKHGCARNGGTPEYQSWKSMIERCYNPNRPKYPDYGGRGVTVCAQWQGEDGPLNFLADMGPRPEGTTLDRKEVNGNYEPGNCRWATAKEQANNKRPRRWRRKPLSIPVVMPLAEMSAF